MVWVFAGGMFRVKGIIWVLRLLCKCRVLPSCPRDCAVGPVYGVWSWLTVEWAVTDVIGLLVCRRTYFTCSTCISAVSVSVVGSGMVVVSFV